MLQSGPDPRAYGPLRYIAPGPDMPERTHSPDADPRGTDFQKSTPARAVASPERSVPHGRGICLSADRSPPRSYTPDPQNSVRVSPPGTRRTPSLSRLGRAPRNRGAPGPLANPDSGL